MLNWTVVCNGFNPLEFNKPMQNFIKTSLSYLLLPCLVWLVTLVMAPSSWAQPANEVTRFKGKLKDMQRGVLMITRDDGTEIMVQPPEKISAFTFVADAKPEFLRRGSMVRFSGTFQANGTPTVPIKTVEIFAPVNKNVKGNEREKFVAGVYPDRHAQPNATIAKCKVVGGLVGLLPNGVMTVQAGKKPVQVQLANDAVFKLVYNNLTLAKPGDSVSVVGFYEPPDETKVRADTVKITTDRVYGEAPEKPAPKKRRTRRSKKDDAADAAIKDMPDDDKTDK